MRIYKSLLLLLLGLLLSSAVGARNANWPELVPLAELPLEAHQVLAQIKRGGPFSYGKDGSVFSNREGLLPRKKRGYYREFTVKTPWVRHRGARRIVSGGGWPDPHEFYYTDDHYASFKRIKE